MAKFTVELNRAGVAELMKCDAMQDGLKEIADKAAERCNAELGEEGYDVKTGEAKTRAYAKVKSSTAHAYYHTLKHNTILKALKKQ